jgi:hypothetical protein
VGQIGIIKRGRPGCEYEWTNIKSIIGRREEEEHSHSPFRSVFDPFRKKAINPPLLQKAEKFHPTAPKIGEWG